MRSGALFFAVIIIAIGTIWLTSKKIEAAWWNDLWQYRKKIIVTNSATAQTNVQIPLTIDTATLVSAGKMQASCGDIRVTDINGNVLPYWVHKCNTSSTVVYAWVSNVIAGASSFFVYYGNGTAVSTEIKTGTSDYPGVSCKTILDHNDSIGDGTYYIDPNAGTKTDSFQAYCDMTTNSGGWTIITSETGTGQQGLTSNTETAGNPLGWAAYNINQQKKVDLSAVSSESIIKRSGGTWIKADHAFFDSNFLVASQHTHWSVTVTASNSTTASAVMGYSNYNIGSGGDYGIVSTSFDHHSTGYYHLNAGCVNHYFYQYGTSYNVNTALGDWAVSHACVPSGTQLGSWYAGMRGTTTPTVLNVAPGSPATEEKTTSPVAYWSLDEGYGTDAHDETINGNNGNLTSMSTAPSPTSGWQTEEKCLSGKCLGFDGTDDSLNVGTIAPTGAATFSTWIYINGANSNYGAIFTNWGGGGNAFFIGTKNGNSSTIEVYFNGGKIYDITSVPLNTWVHLAISHTGSAATAYINGVQTNSQASTLITATGATSIGYDVNRTNYPFKGRIDEPKIYNYARTAAQIKNDYTSGMAGMGKAKEGVGAAIGDKSDKWMTDGLVGYWKMDESSWGSVVDSSGNGNTGTKYGDATVAAGKFGNGGIFDGSGDYVEKTSPVSQPTGNSPTTISAWIKIDSGGISELKIVSFFGTDSGGPSGYGIAVNSSYKAVAAGPSNTGLVTGNTTLNVNQWYFVTGVYNGTTNKIYVNGAEDGSVNYSSMNFSSGVMRVGAWASYNSTYNWKGGLDDVRIYNRALSPSEVSQLYNWAPGPLYYYSLDENTGTTSVNDMSGNSNSATMTGTWTNSQWVPGKFGSALNFNGSNDYLDTPAFDFLGQSTAQFTIEAWVKPRQVGGDIFHNRNDSTGWSTSLLGYKSGKLNFYVYGSSYLASPNNTSANAWTHVAASRDSSGNLKLYENGILVNSGSGSYSSSGSAQKFTIGRFFADCCQMDSPGWFDGLIDDAKLYNYPRSSKQIVEDMNGNHPAGGSPVGSQLLYYKFDEGYGGNAYDSSSNNYSGTITNATWTNSGKFGKAMNFDAAGEHIRKTSFTQIDRINGQELTVSAWIKPSWSSGYADIVVNRSASCYNWILYQHTTDGSIQLHGSLQNKSTYIPPNSVWTHIVATVDSSGISKLYANGILKQTVTGYQYSGSSCGELSIGDYGSNSEPWNGQIDEVKIYNFALTEDEIKLDMNQGKSLALAAFGTDASGNPSNSTDRMYCPPGDTTASCAPIAEWRFDEKSGTTPQDTSGNGKYLTFDGSPSWVIGKYDSGISTDNTVADTMRTQSPYVDLGASWTITTWFKYPLAAVGSSWWTLTRGSGVDHQVIVNRGNFHLGTYDNTSAGFVDSGFVMSTLSSGWHHLSAVGSGSTTVFYIDGKYAGTSAFKSTSDIYAVGNCQGGTQNWGTFDNMKVYDYALSQSQIAWDYNRGKPVGWWKMDEGEGTIAHDESGNGNHGTLTTMDPPNDWVAGKVNSALDFDGSNDYIDAGSGASLNITNAISVAAWVKPTALGSWVGIVNKATDNNWGDGYSLFYYNNRFQFYVKDYTKAAYISSETGSWIHLVGTFDGNTVRIYKNGVEGTSYSYTGAISTTSHGVYIGAGAGTAGAPMYFHNGQIDDVRIFNYALTAQQVKDVMNNGAVNFK